MISDASDEDRRWSASDGSQFRLAVVTPPSPVDYGPPIARLARSDADDVAVRRYRPHEGRLPSAGRGAGGRATGDAAGEESPADLVVIAGSSATLAAGEPWMDELATLVRRLLDRGTPVLGICFGHQLLADALGGAVASMDRPETGFRPHQLTAAGRTDGLFASVPARFVAFTWHEDRVVEVPPGGQVLAQNDRGVQAFRHGDRPALGVQFHPAVSASLARDLVETGALGDDAAREAAGTLTDDLVEEARDVRSILSNAVRLARTAGDVPGGTSRSP